MKKAYIVILVLCALIVIFCLYDTQRVKSDMKSTADKKEAEKLAQIETIIRSRFAESDVAKGLDILAIKVSDYIYRMRISLKFEPTTIREVSTITQGICEVIYFELKRAGIKRSISVWAQRPYKEGLVRVFGHGSYDSYTGKFEWKTQK